MWLPVTEGSIQGPLQFDAHQNFSLLKEWIGCTPGSWVLRTSDLGSARWWCVWETWKNSHVLESSFSSVLGDTSCDFYVSWSWEDFNTQLVRSGNLINSDLVYVWMEILIFSPSRCKSFGWLILSSAVSRSHAEAEAASVVDGVHVACYKHLPKTGVQVTWTAGKLWSDSVSNGHVNVKLRTSLSVIQSFQLQGLVRMSWGVC